MTFKLVGGGGHEGVFFYPFFEIQQRCGLIPTQPYLCTRVIFGRELGWMQKQIYILAAATDPQRTKKVFFTRLQSSHIFLSLFSILFYICRTISPFYRSLIPGNLRFWLLYLHIKRKFNVLRQNILGPMKGLLFLEREIDLLIIMY